MLDTTPYDDLPANQHVSKACSQALWSASGIMGGGFQNVIAVSLFNDALGRRTYLLGADVAGIHRSVDGGKTWKPPSVPRPGVHVAALRWSSRVAGKFFALTNEGFYRTTDFGLTWVRQTVAGAVDADANGVYKTGEGEHPRPTGNLGLARLGA